MTRAIKILALLFLVVPFVMQMRPADENRQRRDIFLYEAARFLCEHRRKYMYMYVFFIIIDKRGINLKWARRIHYIVCVCVPWAPSSWMNEELCELRAALLSYILWLAHVHILLLCVYIFVRGAAYLDNICPILFVDGVAIFTLRYTCPLLLW